MKKQNPFETLKKIIKESEKQCQKDIDTTKNPLLKMIKQDYKDLVEIESKLLLLRMKYGIGIKLVYPKEPKGRWFKGGIDKSK